MRELWNFIDKQMVEVSTILNDVEDTMENYKARKDILDIDRKKLINFNKLSSSEIQQESH
jgi:hypothetical protein